MSDAEVVRILTSIDRRLALLTGPQERELRSALDRTLLRTPARTAMFGAIDGHRDGAEIAKKASVSARAGQLFVKELLELGLVRASGATAGRSVVVERDEGAIVHWFHAQGGSEES